MASSNYIKNVAIVGAGGNSGSYMVDELLKTGKHTVTAISRMDSQSKLPDGIKIARIDYGKQETIVEALKGQDALIITMSVFADKSQQKSLIDAAGEAGVKWILPNEWAPDTDREDVVKDVSIFQGQVATRKYIEDAGKSNHLAMACGFWYEWSMSIPPAYGFDLNKKEVTFFDEGETKISTSAWPQVGRAVAALLSLPIKPEGSNKEASLEHFKNKLVYTNSFTVSQKDMFASVLRVMGDEESDWKISKEPAEERYKGGIEAMKAGDHSDFAKMMYTRVFYPDGNGDFESARGTANKVLGLPKENIDDATRRAIQRAKESAWQGTSTENVK